MEEIELSKLNQSPILGVIDLDKPRAENKFYTLAIVTENRLKKMNLILTFLGVLLMIIEVLWSSIIWAHHDSEISSIFKKFFGGKIAAGIYFIYRWIFLFRHREASHAMNSAAILLMFLLVEISLTSYIPPEKDFVCYVYTLRCLIADSLLFTICILYLYVLRKSTYKIFNTKQLFDTYVTVLSKKLLKYLPISDDMKGEYMEFRDEQEIKRLRKKISKKTLKFDD